MKKLAITSILIATTSLASAQTFDLVSDTLYEPLIGSTALHNARAISLGGAVTASAQDGSALWFNPAALARIPRLELSGDLIHSRLKGSSERLSLSPLAAPPAITPAEENARHTRLGSAYMVVPVPTYRGALTVAGGVTISNNLDRVLSGRFDFAAGTFVDTLAATTDTLITEEIRNFDIDETATGVVHAWQAGFGVDISPRVSVGFAGVYYNGHLDFTSGTSFSGTRTEGAGTPDTSFPVRWDLVTTSTEDISGWGAQGGILFRPRNDLAIGAVIRSPVRFTIDNDQLYTEQRDLGTVDEYSLVPTTRTLQLPFSFTTGAAYLRGNFLFAGDFTYTDWSQTEYKDSPVLTRYNSQLAATHREQVAIGGGVEWVIPSSATTVRAGIRWAQQPYDAAVVVDEQLTISGGLGFLIDQIMAVDIAASHSTARGGNPRFGFDEQYASTRIILTMGYRL